MSHRFGETPCGPEAVAAAVLAYRNPDGGFGNALEPDCRTPHSQPEATRIGLTALAGVGKLGPDVAQGAAAWLGSIVTPEGGIPFCLPTLAGYPRAPWWEPEGDPPPANINPTAALVALFRGVDAEVPWLDTAEDWCFGAFDRMISAGEAPNQYQVPGLAVLCVQASDTDRARRVLADLERLVGDGKVIPLDPLARPGNDTHTPIDVAPYPDHPLRPAFADDVVEKFLDRLEADQQADGGWPIDWPAPGETAVWEWRGARTVDALETLRAYGRLRV